MPQARIVAVDSADDVAAAFTGLGVRPVVLKAGGLLHKTDAGGVVLGLRDAETAAETAREMVAKVGPEAYPLLLQQQVSGLEILVGARRDPQLGAALVVGLGGRHRGARRCRDHDGARLAVPGPRRAAPAAGVAPPGRLPW
ncbi:acetate--CoA ligase family protein [Blastococcus brunescens]|uniref:Acetate--CoA ligase family protein n=1 Tax=Blastococcus brunescens TaxID=1564165 RepID=A0ABZ1B037_9ACTN|nr:acetate--CoA ligase family protein [Blastococcus sp. BMG 8361]WRL64181.1 acetate--CoA ligase family protein [Blastococcus sp. BMG 8361]